MNKKILIGIAGALILGGLLWHKSHTVINPSWAQPTMGTACHITLAGSISKTGLAALREKIDAALEDVNRRMSTWQDDTEISQFNRFQSLEKFPVSPEFADVVQAALSYAEQTGGAFDPTVKPLVDFWGFGPERMSNIEHGTPNDELTRIMDSAGWKKVRLENGALIKAHPAVQLDLAAIAKGYGVDRVAEVIRAAGRKNFIVEIGGEIVADGTNREGRPWRIGIESPEPDKPFGAEIFQTLSVLSRVEGEIPKIAMATSGDYRNFQTRADGTRYSHIIDPHTGRPAQSDVAAVTVIAPRCMDADAVATALFVMGSDKGFQWLENHPEFQAFFILHSPDGQSFSSEATSGFPKLGK